MRSLPPMPAGVKMPEASLPNGHGPTQNGTAAGAAAPATQVIRSPAELKIMEEEREALLMMQRRQLVSGAG
jgi:hypothetical protein